MRMHSLPFLLSVVLAARLASGYADVHREPGSPLQQAPRDLLEEKQVKGLAMQLGGAILKLGDQSFAEAIAPIKLRPELAQAMAHSDNMAALGRVARAADGIECVGFNMLSTEAISLVYVLASEQGPWAIKINAYIWQKEFHVSGFSASASWENVEAMIKTVNELEAKLRISRIGAKGIEPGGPANRSQPGGSQMKATPSAASSGR